MAYLSLNLNNVKNILEQKEEEKIAAHNLMKQQKQLELQRRQQEQVCSFAQCVLNEFFAGKFLGTYI